jgi:hypothetical protein
MRPRFAQGATLVACLGALISASVALAAGEPAKPFVNQAQSAMAYCAELWTIKSHDALDAKMEELWERFDRDEFNAKDQLKGADARMKEAQDEVAKRKKAWDDSVAQWVEEQGKTGTKPNFASDPSLLANAGDPQARQWLHEAEERVRFLEETDGAARLWLASLPTLKASLEACAKDQRAYLGEPPSGPTPPPPPTTTALQMTGAWTVKCSDGKNDPLELSGEFVLKFSVVGATEDESGVSGTLTLGEDKYPLNGIWYKKKNTIQAGAIISDQAWSFTGDIRESQGQLISAGTVFGRLTEDTECDGTYNGTAK